MKTNITNAFKMRNLIKSEIADRIRRLERTNTTSLVVDNVPVLDARPIKNADYGIYMNDILVAHNYLAELNTAIDTANVINRKSIHELDAIKAKLSFLARYEAEAEEFQPSVKRTKRVPTAANPYNEEEIIENYVLNYNAAGLYEMIKQFKSDKLEKEAEITKNNATTEVELSDEFNSWYVDFIA